MLLTIALVVATSADPPAPLPVDAGEADAPRDIVVGRFLFEPYTVATASERHSGGRFGIDMFAASGDSSTRLAGGIRFLLGGDGGAMSGPEGQLLIGVARTISDRALVALVAPLGFAIGGGDFTPHGYAGLEGVAALGHFAREQGPSVRGIELAAGISNRGARARVGVVRPGKEVGWGVGIDWQRDGDTEMIGLYVASVAGR